LFKLPSLRTAALILAGLSLLVGATLAFGYLSSPHATLRITSGFPNTIGQRFVASFVSVMAKTYPRLHFELVKVVNLAESAKAMEDGKVDLAVVRTDVSPPSNGQTVAILRLDVFAFVFGVYSSSIKDPSDLAGKAIAIPEGQFQQFNADSLGTILSYFNVPPEKPSPVPLAKPGVKRRSSHFGTHRLKWRFGKSKLFLSLAVTTKPEAPSIAVPVDRRQERERGHVRTAFAA